MRHLIRLNRLGHVLLLAAMAAAVAVAREGPVRRMVLPAPSPAEVKLREVIPEVRLEGVTFDEAVGALRQQTGANVQVNTKELDALGFDRTAAVEMHLRGVTLARVLEELVRPFDRASSGMGYAIEGDAIVITSQGDLVRFEFVRGYDVRDVLRHGMDPGWRYSGSDADWEDALTPAERLDLLTTSIRNRMKDDTRWETGGYAGLAWGFDGRLYVRQTPENHKKVTKYLDEIRVIQQIGDAAAP